MRLRATCPLLISLVAAACSADAGTSPRLATRPNADRSTGTAGASRPISGSCTLTTLATDPYPAPPVFRQVVTGECRLSHIGNVDVHFVQVVNFASRTQQSLELSYTAPNGDVLYAASTGTNAPSGAGVTFAAEITFVGGTGRFTNATGRAQATGAANIAAGTSQYVLDGWIAYDAGNRGRE